MSFLAPLFLWLIPLTLIPLLIHLLNKRKIINVNFSSLIFLKQIENESINRINLLQLLLLILRMIIVLIIVLMISRPAFYTLFSKNNDSLYSVILVDDSFSSSSQINLLKNSAKEIIDLIDDKSELLWINSNNSLSFQGLKEDLPPLDNILTRSYLSEPLTNSIKKIKSKSLDILKQKELFILTNSISTNINEINQFAEQLDDFNIYVLVHPPLNNNLSVINVKLDNEVFTPDDKILIDVYIKNNGSNNIKNKSLNLIINDMILGQQLISINEGEIKKFTFKTIIGNYGTNNCLIRLEDDDDIDDNSFYFSLNIPEKQNIALIYKTEYLGLYINESINVLNKSNNTFLVERYTSFNDPKFNINMFNSIFLLSPELLDEIEDSRIEEYLFNGGHFLLFPNINNNNLVFENINKITTQIDESYDNIKLNNPDKETFQYLTYNNNISSLKSIFDPKGNNNLGTDIKLFDYIKLPLSPKSSQLSDENRNSVWNRHILDSGIFDLFGFSLDLKSTNFPLSGSFIPFINSLLYSNTFSNDNIYKITNQRWIYNSKNFYKNLYHVLPNGDRKIINQSESKYVSTDVLTHPGFHSIYANDEILSTISVNINDRTKYRKNTELENLKNKINKSVMLLNTKNIDVLEKIDNIRSGKELWRYLIYILAFLIILEMLISNVSIKRK